MYEGNKFYLFGLMADKNTKKLKKICIIAGDPSGDIHGARLIIDIKKCIPDSHFFGIGGTYMSHEGMELVFHNKNTAFMGFAEIVKHLSFIRNMFEKMEFEIKSRKPDAVILIDYPGFNLKIAKKIRKFKIPVFYYIAPQAWAWKENRVKTIKKYIKHLFVIFPFEERYFSQFKIPTTFVGHPFGHSILNRTFPTDSLKKFNLDPELPIISFLPGSREQELRNHMPTILQAIEALRIKYPHWQFALSKAPFISSKLWSELCHGYDEYTYSGNLDILLSHSTAVGVASGTASLQVAFHKKPMVIFYVTSNLTYKIAKRLTKLKSIGMINILNGSELFPELIQHDFTVERLVKEIENQVFTFSHQPIKMTKMKNLVEGLYKENSYNLITDTIKKCVEKQ